MADLDMPHTAFQCQLRDKYIQNPAQYSNWFHCRGKASYLADIHVGSEVSIQIIMQSVSALTPMLWMSNVT